MQSSMHTLLDHPIVLLVVSFALLWALTRLGAAQQGRRGPLDEAGRADFDIVLGATLTLLGLLIGFSFSMASSRYDERKGYEEGEANAIGTAYFRAELLPSADASKMQELLREYNGLRIRFYTTADRAKARELNIVTEQMQVQLWKTVAAASRAAPTPISALAAASINDAINAQGYAQAATWNRIPVGAWALLCVLGGVATAMIGYRFRMAKQHYMLMLIMPGIVAIAFFLIADIDCPTGGVIRIMPENLQALAPTLT
jgi:hypothetical protein